MIGLIGVFTCAEQITILSFLAQLGVFEDIASNHGSFYKACAVAYGDVVFTVSVKKKQRFAEY